MQCPQCDTALRLVVDVACDDQRRKPKALHRFRIIDLLGVTALVAMQLVAFSVEAKPAGSEWPLLLYLSPTAITCLVHLRLRLSISVAMVIHSAVTLVWTFLHSLGQSAAINAYNAANSVAGRNYQIDVYSNAWSETVGAAAWSLALAAAYGLICYVAVTADKPLPDSPSAARG